MRILSDVLMWMKRASDTLFIIGETVPAFLLTKGVCITVLSSAFGMLDLI